jgi:diguanylate cyclase (GGDEF)-like protein/PAS domain S-box-containing protein
MQETDHSSPDALQQRKAGDASLADGSSRVCDPTAQDPTAGLGLRIDDVHAVVWEAEPTRTHHTFVNEYAEGLLGYPSRTWLTEHQFWISHLHPDDRAHIVDGFRVGLERGDQHQHTYRMLHADGTTRWVKEFVHRVKIEGGPEGTPRQRLRGTIIDVTEFKHAQRAQSADTELYRSLYDEYPAVCFVLDQHGAIEQVNRWGAEQLGYPAGELHGITLHRLLLSARDEPAPLIDLPTLQRIAERDQAIRLKRRDGTLLPTHVRTRRVPIPGTTAHTVHVICEPVAEAQPVLATDAPEMLDPLTGTLNRTEFERRLQRLLYRDYRDNAKHVLALLDIDQFAVVNYRLGNGAGDEALREVAEILPDCLRPGDVIGRTGSDEFALLLENCSLARAQALCRGAVDVIEQHRFEWAGTPLRLSASVGLVRIDPAAQGVSELMSAAENARRTASRRARAGIHAVDPTKPVHDTDDAHIAWAAELEDALDGDRLELHFQPIRSLYPADGSHDRERHYEILLRLRRDQRLLGPQRFLLAAERHQLASEVDRWVLGTTVRWLASRPHQRVGRELCCINISASSICDRRFVEDALSQLKCNSDIARSLCFEITETAVIANMDEAIRGMESLRNVGCRFSLDDFGSGMASFSYLRRLPVDYLKIDGSFVRGAGCNDDEARFLDLINQIGHHAGKKTVAEFVESEQTLSRVHDIGIDFAQGYQIGRPRPISEFEAPAPRRSAIIKPFPTHPWTR